MSAETIALRLVIAGDVSGAKAALKDLGGETKKTQSNLAKGLKVAQGAAAVGLTAIAGIATKGVLDYEQLTSSVSALQRQTKISAEDASLLVGQWQRYGVTIEAGSKATVILSKNMDTAQAAAMKTQAEIDGLDKSSKTYGDQLSTLQAKLVDNQGAFARLGITLEEVRTLSPADMLEEVRQKLAALPVGAERTALSAKLLGRGFMGLSKWIGASSTDLDALNQQLKGTGQVMDNTELAKAKDDMKQMALLQVDLRGLSVEVGRSAMPIIHEMVPALKKLLAIARPLAPHLVQIGGALAAFLVVTKAAQGIGTLLTVLSKLKAILVGGKIASGLTGVASAAGGVGDGFVTTAGGETIAQSLLPGAGQGFISESGVKGAGKGTAALRASAFGGAGSLIVPVAIMSIAAAAAGAIYLGVKAANEEGKAGGSFWDQVKAGLAGPGDWFYNLAGGPQADKFIAKYGDLTDRLAALPKTPQTPYLKADFQKAMNVPQVKAAIELGTPQTRAQLKVIRDAIVENLNVPIKEATRLTQLIFPQSWAGRAKMDIKTAEGELAKLKETLKKKIAFHADTGPTVAAIKVLEARIERMRANAARPARTGRLDTSGWTGPINAAMQSLLEFRDMSSQGITPGSMSQHGQPRFTAGQVGRHSGRAAAGAYVRRTPGGTLLRVGEGKYDEVVAQVLPGKGEQKARGGETHFHLHIGQLIGTDERAARQLWNTVKPIAMSDMRMKMAMSRG